jgi:hypothetical protein
MEGQDNAVKLGKGAEAVEYSPWKRLQESDVLEQYMTGYSLSAEELIHTMKLSICDVLGIKRTIDLRSDGGIAIAADYGSDVKEKILYPRLRQQRRIYRRFESSIMLLDARKRAETISKNLRNKQSSIAYAEVKEITPEGAKCILYVGLKTQSSSFEIIPAVTGILSLDENNLLPNDGGRIRAILDAQNEGKRKALLCHVSSFSIEKNGAILFRLKRKSPALIAFRLVGLARKSALELKVKEPSLIVKHINWKRRSVKVIFPSNTRRALLAQVGKNIQKELGVYCIFEEAKSK